MTQSPQANPQSAIGDPQSATVCLLTPLAQGALAAVRLFGPGTAGLLERLFQPARPARRPPQRGELALGLVVDPAGGQRIDQAILHLLPRNLGAELTLHGGVRIVQRVMAACQSLGAARLDPARPADRDQLWNQSLLLARAAGTANPAIWADIELALPRARTRAAANWLLAQASAGLAALLRSLLDEVRAARPITHTLNRLLAERPAWARAIDGVRIAIVGPANAGKSTLFNALAATAAAVVFDQPGTTRDYVWQWVNLDGLAAELIDTAGLRGLPDHAPPPGSAGELELRAAALAEPLVRSADLRLVVLDATAEPTAEELARVEALASSGPALVAVNKTDMPAGWSPSAVADRLAPGHRPLAISALRGSGLPELGRAIRATVGAGDLSQAAAGLFADRQIELVASASRSADPAVQTNLLRCLLDG